MKSHLYTKLAVLIVGLAASATAFADVKIKSRQTASGQTMENTTLIKGKRQRSEMMNGQLISITQCDMRRDVRINPAAQTYQVSTFDILTGANSSSVQNPKSKTQNQKGGVITMLVTNKDTGERKQMFGYTARHIITTMETSSSPDACSLTKSKMQIDGWYIDAEFALDCAANRAYANYGDGTSGGCQDRYDVKTVGAAKKGYPISETMTMFDDAGREIMTTTNEVLEISKATLDASLFDVPTGYREVKSATELYANLGATATIDSTNDAKSYSGDKQANNREQMNQTLKNLTQTKTAPVNQPGAKKEGTIRIGLMNVKTGAVGDGINPQDLAGAVQNTLGEYLKDSQVELVPLGAKLASAAETEAKEKDCDFVLYATVSYKKGGGGFGMFKSVAPMFTNVIPVASTAGAVAGTVASTAVITAATATANVKAKDEMSLEFNLKSPTGSAPPLSKQLKMKAKSAGEDILSPMLEQAAQTILDTVIK